MRFERVSRVRVRAGQGALCAERSRVRSLPSVSCGSTFAAATAHRCSSLLARSPFWATRQGDLASSDEKR